MVGDKKYVLVRVGDRFGGLNSRIFEWRLRLSSSYFAKDTYYQDTKILPRYYYITTTNQYDLATFLQSNYTTTL